MRERDRGSFEEWARARQQQLVRRAYLVTGDHHRAEDLVQEALIGVAMRWDTLRDGNPDAWVRTVVYRANVSWWRRHRREVPVDRAEVFFAREKATKITATVAYTDPEGGRFQAVISHDFAAYRDFPGILVR